MNLGKQFLSFVLAISISGCSVISKKAFSPVTLKEKQIGLEVGIEVWIENSSSGRTQILNPLTSEHDLLKTDFARHCNDLNMRCNQGEADYLLNIVAVDKSNFHFTRDDILISFPYYLWGTISILTLGIIPTKVTNDRSFEMTLKNKKTLKELRFRSSISLVSWISIVALDLKFRTARTLMNEAMEPQIKEILIDAREKISSGEI